MFWTFPQTFIIPPCLAKIFKFMIVRLWEIAFASQTNEFLLILMGKTLSQVFNIF